MKGIMNERLSYLAARPSLAPRQLHVFILFFFARPTNPPSREGGRWETKDFMGMAYLSSISNSSTIFYWTSPVQPELISCSWTVLIYSPDIGSFFSTWQNLQTVWQLLNIKHNKLHHAQVHDNKSFRVTFCRGNFVCHGAGNPIISLKWSIHSKSQTLMRPLNLYFDRNWERHTQILHRSQIPQHDKWKLLKGP